MSHDHYICRLTTHTPIVKGLIFYPPFTTEDTYSMYIPSHRHGTVSYGEEDFVYSLVNA